MNGRVVIMLFLCNRHNATAMFFIRLIGVGRFWQSVGVSSLGANLFWSRFWCHCGTVALQMSHGVQQLIPQGLDMLFSNVESVQWKIESIWFPDSWLSRVFNSSSFCVLMGSWKMRFCNGVCWVSSPGSWGLRKQHVWLNSYFMVIFRSAFSYCMASSWFVPKKGRIGVGLVGLIFFVWFGFTIENVAIWLPFFNVYLCSTELFRNTLNLPFWVFVDARRMMKSSLSSRSGEGCIMPVI